MEEGAAAIYFCAGLYESTNRIGDLLFRSIARNAKVSEEELAEAVATTQIELDHPKEWKLAKLLLKFPEVRARRPAAELTLMFGDRGRGTPRGRNSCSEILCPVTCAITNRVHPKGLHKWLAQQPKVSKTAAVPLSNEKAFGIQRLNNVHSLPFCPETGGLLLGGDAALFRAGDSEGDGRLPAALAVRLHVRDRHRLLRVLGELLRR